MTAAWNLEQFARFPLGVEITPADTALWITDEAFGNLAAALSSPHLVDSVPETGVWVGFESPVNVIGCDLHAVHIKSFEALVLRTHLLVAARHGVPSHKALEMTPPRQIRDALRNEGVTSIAVYAYPDTVSKFHAELTWANWGVRKPPRANASTKAMADFIRTHGGTVSPNADGDLDLLAAIIHAAFTASVSDGIHNITTATERVDIDHPLAGYADITVVDAL